MPTNSNLVGTIVGTYQLAITIGLLLAAVVNNSTKDRNDTGSYRIPVAVQFAWSIILVGGMLLLPETPRMWIKRGSKYYTGKACLVTFTILIFSQGVNGPPNHWPHSADFPSTTRLSARS